MNKNVNVIFKFQVSPQFHVIHINMHTDPKVALSLCLMTKNFVHKHSLLLSTGMVVSMQLQELQAVARAVIQLETGQVCFIMEEMD